jgi:uracil-DNA glycosylase family 4
MALDLDPRRRAMLEEMGVRVWLPETAAAPVAASTAEPGPVPRPVRTAADKSLLPVGRPFEPTARAADVATMDWPALQAAVAACRACGLCQGRRNTVFGVGPGQADWLIVGEAPGEQEDLQAKPFVGPSGHLLDNMLKAIGQHRVGSQAPGAGTQPHVYITNVLKCRPPGNRNPEPQEVVQCAPFLQRQIELLRPRVIVAMGRFATQSLLQGLVADVERVPLGKLRGRPYRYQVGSATVPVVVTYHPAYLLRNLAAKAQAWDDLCLALQLMRQEPAS